jgi:hypothetical protein
VSYIETGISGRKPFRKMFSDRTLALRDFNRHKAFSNVYHSIYWFREQEEKFDRYGNFIRWGPDYNTAIITKINLDLDSFKTTRFDEKTQEIYTDEGLLSIRRFADWCDKHNYAREYNFSGGGFYGIVKASGEPLRLRDGMMSLGIDAGLEIDPATVGDTSRMRRVLNSFNFGDHRKCYCIPLREEELSLDYNKIWKLASKPRFRQKFIYGEESYVLNHFKIDEDKIKKKELFVQLKQNPDAEVILKKYGWTLDDLCDPIKHILSMEYVGHYLRYELIKYFKSVLFMEFEDLVNLLVALIKEEGIHSLTEGQAQYAYIRHRTFNPKKLKAMGICPPNCHKCQRIANVI